MLRLLTALALLVLVVLGVWFFQRTDKTPLAAGSGPRAQDERSDAAKLLEPESDTADPGVEETQRAVVDGGVPAADEAQSDDMEVLGDRTQLVGRLVHEDGAPAVGAALRIHGWTGNRQRAERFGLPETWEDPEGTTDADGHFAFLFEAPRAYQFTLKVRAEGAAVASWRWHELPQGKRVDLGTTILQVPGNLRVRIVDENERVLSEGWSIYADAALPPDAIKGEGLAGDRDETRVNSHAAGPEGVFLLEGLPAGPVQLKGHSQVANWIQGPLVTVVAGETIEAEIHYRGPDIGSRIVVSVFPKNTSTFEVDELEIRAFGQDGRVRTAERLAGSSQGFTFNELPAGTYRLEIDDPRFVPWSKDGVSLGSNVSAHLKGNAGIVLDVIEASSGAAVERYALHANREKVRWSPSSFKLLDLKNPHPTDSLFDAIVPGDYSLTVSSPGFGDAQVEAFGLGAGEFRAILVELAPPSGFEGRVVTARGEPVSRIDVRVALTLPDEPDLSPQERLTRLIEISNDRRQNAASATSDGEGVFRFDALGAGTYDLWTDGEGSLKAKLDGVKIAAGEVRSVELRLPPGAFAVGRVIGPAETDLSSFRLGLYEVNEADDQDEATRIAFQSRRMTGQTGQGDWALESDGSFRLGPVPAGRYSLTLRYPDITTVNINSRHTMSGPSFPLDDLVLVAGDNEGLTYDVRDIFPGRIVLDLEIDGRPASSGVELRLVGLQKGLYFNTSGKSDSTGQIDLENVPPGDYTVYLKGDTWVGCGPALVTIEPSRTTEANHAIRVHAGTLRILDADGSPLAETTLQIEAFQPGSDDFVPLWFRPRTDKEGRLALTLPAGSLRVRSIHERGFPLGPPVALNWTANGPGEEVITVLESED